MRLLGTFGVAVVLVSAVSTTQAMAENHISALVEFQHGGPVLPGDSVGQTVVGPYDGSVQVGGGGPNSAEAAYGYLRAQTHQQVTGTGGFLSDTVVSSQSSAAYANVEDTFTVLGPKTGTTGWLTFGINIDGEATAGGSGTPDFTGSYDATAGFSIQLAGQGVNASNNSWRPLALSFTESSNAPNFGIEFYDIYGSDVVGRSLFSDPGAMFGLHTISIPYVAGVQIDMSMSASCNSHIYGGLVTGAGIGIGACDMSHTITWGGLLGATDANGAPIDVTISSASGVDYTRAILPPDEMSGGVPEPSTWAMIIAGLGLAGAGLRRRRALVAA